MSRRSLVSPQVVAVLKGGNSKSITVRGTPLAITMSISISNSSHSNFRGNDSRVELGDGLGGSRVAGVALADSISRRSLVSPQVVAVLKGGNSKSVTIRGTPLAITMSISISNGGHSDFRGNDSRVEFGDGLGGSGVARVALAESISIRGISTPLANAVSLGSPNSGLAVAIGGRGPDSQTRSTVANSIGG